MVTVIRVVALGLVMTLLSSCTFMRAITFQSDPQSFKKENSKVTIQYYRSNACKEGASKEEVAPLLAAALVTIAIDIASSEIQNYLEKKKKEFTASYSGTINAPSYYGRVKEKEYSAIAFNCLRVMRTIKDGDKPEVTAFDWIATLVPNDSGTALAIRTDTIKLDRAAARTDQSSRKIDVSVEVKIDATTLNDKGDIVTSTIADKTLAFQGMKIEEPTTQVVTSSWFPAIPRSQAEMARCDALQPAASACKGVSPVSISVLVTEVGSGGDTFGDLSKQIGDNKKTLEDAVNKAVTNALTPQSSGGSSKGGTN